MPHLAALQMLHEIEMTNTCIHEKVLFDPRFVLSTYLSTCEMNTYNCERFTYVLNVKLNRFMTHAYPCTMLFLFIVRIEVQ